MNPSMHQPPLVIGMLLYPAFTMLDLIGPLTVFSMHSKLHLLWKTLEPVASDSGVAMVPTTLLSDCPEKLDVLFVPGGFGTEAAMADAELIAFLQSAAQRADYITSVCSGALLLGAAGLMKGYRATTHWAIHDTLSQFGAQPVKARVVTDRNRISGGGVTAGIDLALALIEADYGPEVALEVARDLVVYLKREGGQAQYSAPLRFQVAARDFRLRYRNDGSRPYRDTGR